MLRRLIPSAAVLTVTPLAAVFVPVAGQAPAKPHPVAPVVHHLSVPAAAPAAGVAQAHAAGGKRVLSDTGQRSVAAFDLVGASWDKGTLGKDDTIQVRVHGSGGWSGWTALSPGDAAPDGGSQDAKAAARATGGEQTSAPVWVGDSDGVELRVLSSDASGPAHLKAVLVNGGHSPADTAVTRTGPTGAVAHADTGEPQIYTRADWGADPSLRAHNGASCTTPDYSSTIKVGFVHHTDTSNDYTPADVPGIIRSIYAYHVESNGWCDIGYNFLIDKFGRIWEGRYGGITKPVIGAHTGGFNTDSFGTSLIGNYASVAPSSAMLDALEHLFAWKLSLYYRDPAITEQLQAGSFSGQRFPTGSTVTFQTISGHRDADYTTCPGDAAYADLPQIRTQVRAIMGTGFVDPSINDASQTYGSVQGFTVHAGVITSMSYAMQVLDDSGTKVAEVDGTASPSSPLTATWDGRLPSGAWAPPGTYHVQIFGASASGTPHPYLADLKIAPPIDVSGPSSANLGDTVTLAGNAPVGSQVTLFLHKRGAAGYAPADTTVTNSAGHYSVTFRADDDYRWYTAEGGFHTDPGLTKIAPTLQPGPDHVAKGGSVPVSGTALPGSQVQLELAPPGGGYSAGPSVTAAANGSWQASYTADSTETYYAASNTLRSKSATTALYAPPTATGPSYASYDERVTLTGSAQPGDAVSLWLHKRGTGGYWRAGTINADSTGAYRAEFTAVDDYRWYVTSSSGQSASGLTQVKPTISGPSTAAKGAAVYLTGTAVPGAPVDLWLHQRFTNGYVKVGTITAGADGSYTARFFADTDYRWYVESRGIASDRGLTQIPR